MSWGQQGLGVSSVTRRGSWESGSRSAPAEVPPPAPSKTAGGPELLAEKPLHVEGCGHQRVWPCLVLPMKTLKADSLSILPGSAESQHPLCPRPGDTEPGTTLQTRVQPKNPHVLLITKFSLINSQMVLTAGRKISSRSLNAAVHSLSVIRTSLDDAR